MENVELIDVAIANLRTKGWCQGISKDNHGRMCLIGAFLSADIQNLQDQLGAIWSEAGRIATANYPERVTWDDVHGSTRNAHDLDVAHAVAFNNHHFTTVEEVIAVLEKTRAHFAERA